MLLGRGSACGLLKKHFPKPEAIPSRFYRNAPETTSQVVRSSSGYNIYRLVLSFQVKAEEREDDRVRVLFLDLSPSGKRLVVEKLRGNKEVSSVVFTQR